jgi:hypothetical protein
MSEPGSYYSIKLKFRIYYAWLKCTSIVNYYI